MKKVLQATSKYIFAAFGVAILALLMSLTYSALARIFPASPINRLWGLVMFDIAAMCWALAFAFSSETTSQYASSAIGFIVAFVGTLGMVAAEVMLSSGAVESGDIAQYMVYGFIIVTALHSALVYAHHATGAEMQGQIEVGIARGEIVTEARKQATKSLDESKTELAHVLTQDIVTQAKRDLGLIEADPDMPFLPKEYEATTGALNVDAPPDIWARVQDILAPYKVDKITKPITGMIKKNVPHPIETEQEIEPSAKSFPDNPEPMA